MIAGLYRFLSRLSRWLGVWVLGIFAWFVSTGYFIFRPGRVRSGLDFYRALFPDRSFCARLALVWRQFHGFAALFAERQRLSQGGDFEAERVGFEHVEKLNADGAGGILLMSHVGAWELAARIFKRRQVPLMLFMGQRPEEQVEKLQKQELVEGGLRLVVSSTEGADAMASLEGLRFLRQGGLVSFAGDRLWSAAQRSVQVDFLGRKALLPAGPHLFALAARAPICVFFVARCGRRRYGLEAREPYRVEAAGRADRWAAVERSAQRYAGLLEDWVRRHPEQWYHFEPFLED